MEELLELLDECTNGRFKSEDDLRLCIEMRGYCRNFIKWLVENDKIDTDAYKTVYSGDLDKRKTLTMSSGGDEFYQVTEYGAYESLLMLLSISNSPIEDLISYLK